MLEPLPYQSEGIDFLRSNKVALLADDPGLGKTAQALLALPEKAAVLVLCPKVAKGVWKAELEKWRAGEWSVSIPPRKGSFRAPRQGEVVITTYDSLPLPEPDLEPQNFVLIADEAHLVKNPKATRSKSFRAWCRVLEPCGSRIWMLTGTPMPNNPIELWSLLAYTRLAGIAYKNKEGFLKAFQGRWVETNFGGEYRWGNPTPEAAKGFNKVALRRRREEVLKDLPPKFYQEVSVPITPQARLHCEELLEKMGKAGVDYDRLVDLAFSTARTYGIDGATLSAVRHSLAYSKIPAMMEFIEDAEAAGDPVVVFGCHVTPLEALSARPGWRLITGATPAAERTKIAEDFQAGKLSGIAASIKAAGVAITLTRAHRCLFIERDWTPANNSQAEARLQRIGQKDNVIITTLVADHAVDKRVYDVLLKKQAIIEATM